MIVFGHNIDTNQLAGKKHTTYTLVHARRTHDTYLCTHSQVHPYTQATRMTHTRARMQQCTPTRTPYA